MPQRLFTIGSPAQLGLGDLLARFVQGFVCKAIEETQSHRKEARHTCSKMGPRATQPFYLLEETQGHWKEARHKSSFAQLKKPRVPGKKYDINVPKMGPRAARPFDSIKETQSHWKEARHKCSSCRKEWPARFHRKEKLPPGWLPHTLFTIVSYPSSDWETFSQGCSKAVFARSLCRKALWNVRNRCGTLETR